MKKSLLLEDKINESAKISLEVQKGSPMAATHKTVSTYKLK